jgi:hypothetical protein
MKRTAQVVSWLMVILFGVGALAMTRINPRLVGPEHGLVLLPFAAALAVLHFGSKPGFAISAIALNGLWGIAGVVAISFGIAYESRRSFLGIALVLLLCVVPTTLNILALWRELRSTPNHQTAS